MFSNAKIGDKSIWVFYSGNTSGDVVYYKKVKHFG